MRDDAPRVLGRYALFGEIAAGGMATVHLGRLLGPVGFARTVAIKRLHAQFAKDPEFAAMFLDEARVAARIRHPNVVSTLDVVALEGELFLVMEYVEGESLASILRALRGRGERLPLKVLGTILTQTLYGLHAAHEAKDEKGEPLDIIHRDVSPHNILVGVDGAARVLDFGVAKAAGRIQTTRDGQVKGKLAYMAMEQIAGKTLDRRVDVYAACVVAWEALTGRRLLDGDSDAAVIHAAMSQQIQPPSSLVPGLPAELDGIVMKGLEKSPERRWSTASELAEALEEVLGTESPRKVGAVVLACAGEALQRRADHVKEVESRSSTLSAEVRGLATASSDVTRADAQAAARPAPTDEPGSVSRIATVQAQTPDARPRRGVVAWVAGGAVAAAVLLGLVFLSRRAEPPSTAAPPSGAAPSAQLGAAAPTTAPTASALAQPDGSAVGAASTATTTPKPSPSGGPLHPAHADPAQTAKPKPPVTAAPASGGCNPPYYFEGGVKKFKRECL